PGLATVVIVNVVPWWNDFFFPLLFLPSKTWRTIPLGMQIFFGQHLIDWSLVFSGMLLASLPLLIIYVLMSRRFIAGLGAGAGKGGGAAVGGPTAAGARGRRAVGSRGPPPGVQSGLRRVADAHAPHVGPVLQRFPGELAGVLGGELVVERLGVVVVDEHVGRARREGVPGREDHPVPLGGYEPPDVELLVAASGPGPLRGAGEVVQ